MLADHARAVAFLMADGVYPSNDGRGYVLRRIVRRAVRHGYLLGRSEPTLVHLATTVVDGLRDAYPELEEKRAHIEKVTRLEDERFLETVEGGLERLELILSGAGKTVSGADAFKLYDTYGFPLDLTELIAAERGWTVDTRGFDQALEAQQRRSRSSAQRISRLAVRRYGGMAVRGPGRVWFLASGIFEMLRDSIDRLKDAHEITHVIDDVFYYEHGIRVFRPGYRYPLDFSESSLEIKRYLERTEVDPKDIKLQIDISF